MLALGIICLILLGFASGILDLSKKEVITEKQIINDDLKKDLESKGVVFIDDLNDFGGKG